MGGLEGRGALRVLVDTHTALWWADRDRRLSDGAERTIARADRVLISPISCWEIATLARLGRISFDRSPEVWIADLLAQDRVEPAPLSEGAAVTAGLLEPPFPGDPADRLLYATAMDLMVPFVTKDRAIAGVASERGDVQVVW